MNFEMIERLIRDGAIQEAQKRLLEMRKKGTQKVDEATHLAGLFRRVDLNSSAVAILAPFVLGRGRQLPVNDTAAKIEYANSLKNLGLVTEARNWLSHDDLQNNLNARLVRGISYLHDYELQKAENVLTNLYHSHRTDYDNYTVQITGVNLCIALLRDVESTERQKKFEVVFEAVRQACRIRGYSLLLQALWVIDLQFCYLSKRPDRSEVDVDLESLPEFSRYTAQLYFLLLNAKNPHFIKQAKQLREECRQKNLYELVREIDFQVARLQNDQRGLEKVYLGTLYPAYRSKIADLMVSPVNDQHREIGNSHVSEMKSFVLDDLKEQPLMKRAIEILSQEVYAPLSSQVLWDQLMNGRHYRMPSSKDSIHQLMKRIRNYFKSEGIPLKIKFERTGYRLLAISHQRVKIIWAKDQSLIERLKQKMTIQEFSLSDVMKAMPETPKRTLQLWLANAVLANELIKEGKNKGTKYRYP